jgi:hypothetical protein
VLFEGVSFQQLPRFQVPRTLSDNEEFVVERLIHTAILLLAKLVIPTSCGSSYSSRSFGSKILFLDCYVGLESYNYEYLETKKGQAGEFCQVNLFA